MTGHQGRIGLGFRVAVPAVSFGAVLYDAVPGLVGGPCNLRGGFSDGVDLDIGYLRGRQGAGGIDTAAGGHQTGQGRFDLNTA